MPIQKRAPCQICRESESKYTCAQCKILYCSLSCYKQHKSTSCQSQVLVPNSNHHLLTPRDSEPLVDASASDNTAETYRTAPPTSTANLRPLTSLKWPYVPEESAYPDPLKRDDPKPLQIPQYEVIATSPDIRRALASHPQLPTLLRSLDQLRGPEREEALERALGVSPASNPVPGQTEEDARALRELAEAVEAAVRGGKHDVLGLDWGTESREE